MASVVVAVAASGTGAGAIAIPSINIMCKFHGNYVLYGKGQRLNELLIIWCERRTLDISRITGIYRKT